MLRLIPTLIALLIPSALATPLVDGDAGTGHDAPDDHAAAIEIAWGQTYEGTLGLAGVPPRLDLADWFALPVEEGDTVTLRVDVPGTCFYILQPDAEPETGYCYYTARTHELVAERDGLLRIGITFHSVAYYTFTPTLTA